MKREIEVTEGMAIGSAFNEWDKLIRRKKKSLAKKVITSIKKQGLRAIKLQLEFLEKNPLTELKVPELDYFETVSSWREGIRQFEYDLKKENV